MPSPPQIEILDLRHFNARQLRPLLTEEAAVWNRRLDWDYTSSTELLLQYLDSQILPGFVALLRGRLLGYTFCVYEGNKAVIGDLYVSIDAPSRLAVTQTLLRHQLEVLEASPDVDRIEAQLLLFDPGTLIFEGFKTYPRLFMQLALSGPDTPSPLPTPEGFALERWSPGLYQPTAELIHACYQGHLDSEINDQYRTLHGSLRFLHNIVRFPGCGTFDPAASWVMRESRTNALAGVLLCSRISPDVAHLTQLCIAPVHRGSALGKVLLHHVIDRLPLRDYRSLTLTVSEFNQPARRLYYAAGFNVRLPFEALVLDKTLHPERFRIKPLQSAALRAEPTSDDAPTGLFSFARRKTRSPRS